MQIFFLLLFFKEKLLPTYLKVEIKAKCDEIARKTALRVFEPRIKHKVRHYLAELPQKGLFAGIHSDVKRVIY